MVTYFTEQIFHALICFLSCSTFLNKKYLLQTLKAAVKRNFGSAATSDKPQSKMAKACQCETPEAIPNTTSWKMSSTLLRFKI